MMATEGSKLGALGRSRASLEMTRIYLSIRVALWQRRLLSIASDLITVFPTYQGQKGQKFRPNVIFFRVNSYSSLNHMFNLYAQNRLNLADFEKLF